MSTQKKIVNKFQKQNNNKDIHLQQQKSKKKELKSLKKYPQNINYRNKSLIFFKSHRTINQVYDNKKRARFLLNIHVE